jgi:hypothetical protein
MTDPSHRGRRASTRNVSPALVALAGWILPGAGYVFLGGENRARGFVVGATILSLFLLGILLGGIRVIDVPGYDRLGGEVRLDPAGRRIDTTPAARSPHYNTSPWALGSRGFFGEIANKPWYVGQILAGPICLVASAASLSAARHGVPMAHARLNEIGTLYTAVAGMLNLLVIIDAAHRAAHAHRDDENDTCATPTSSTSAAGGAA